MAMSRSTPKRQVTSLILTTCRFGFAAPNHSASHRCQSNAHASDRLARSIAARGPSGQPIPTWVGRKAWCSPRDSPDSGSSVFSENRRSGARAASSLHRWRSTSLWAQKVAKTMPRCKPIGEVCQRLASHLRRNFTRRRPTQAMIL
jgi:hypothetical protein